MPHFFIPFSSLQQPFRFVKIEKVKVLLWDSQPLHIGDMAENIILNRQ